MSDLAVELTKMRADQWVGCIGFALCCVAMSVLTWQTLVVKQRQDEQHRRELAELTDWLEREQL